MSTDLSKFGNREKILAADLLTALAKTGWPDNFDMYNVQLYIDSNWGDVYLTNENGEFAALTDQGKIERYYFSPSGKYKGFFEDLVQEYTDMDDIEDMDWFKGIAEEIGRLEEIPGQY